MKPTVLLAAVAAALAAAGGSASAAPPNNGPFGTVAAPLRLAQANQVDMRPSPALTDAELRARIMMLRQYSDTNQMIGNIPASVMLRMDRGELQRRQGQTDAGQPPQPGQPPLPGQLPGQLPQAGQLPQPGNTAPRPQQPQQPQVAQPQPPQVTQPPAQSAPQAPRQPKVQQPEQALALVDLRSASQLTDAELRNRIRLVTEFLRDNQGGRRAGELRSLLDTDNAELNRRITVTTGVDVERLDANREARRLLGDRRAAEELNDKELRERVGLTRGVLALEGLDPRFEDQMRRMLSRDRGELRSRVAEAEPQVVPGTRRAEGEDLRRDMLRDREERRRRLQDPSYRIDIPRDRVARRPLPTIPLAEAYERDLERQLSAPPSRRIDRRYTIDEYRANPSLRTIMPGIEVDTVRFGFNEDFLRIEEIAKLDRIGELLERIVAGNPNEVFLIEGHTDLVGSDAYNLALSYRRASAVRDALIEFYYIPRENLEIAGYGEQFPRIPTEYEEPENRRVTVRRITPLLYGYSQ